MNPFTLALAQVWGARWRSLALALLVALSVSISIAVATQERAIKSGSARAAAPSDLVIGAPGSPRSPPPPPCACPSARH